MLLYSCADIVQWLVCGLAKAITLGQTLAIKLAINKEFMMYE